MYIYMYVNFVCCLCVIRDIDADLDEEEDYVWSRLYLKKHLQSCGFVVCLL